MSDDVFVCSSPRASAEMPKSPTLTCPKAPTMRLAGLMSRCTMPTSCAAISASLTCCPISTSSGSVSGPTAKRSAIDPPARYSITRQGPSGPTKISSTVTTYGWPFTRSIASSSRFARCHAGDESWTSRSALIATTPFVDTRVARYTRAESSLTDDRCIAVAVEHVHLWRTLGGAPQQVEKTHPNPTGAIARSRNMTTCRPGVRGTGREIPSGNR